MIGMVKMSNYRLSCYVNRVKHKCGYTIELEGAVIVKSVFKLPSENLKESILETVYRGLKAVKKFMKHEDLLNIEIQNIHLCEWLSGLKEYRGYEEYLDKVFLTLESIDCSYKFRFEKKPFASVIVNTEDVDKLKVSSTKRLLEEFK